VHIFFFYFYSDTIKKYLMETIIYIVRWNGYGVTGYPITRLSVQAAYHGTEKSFDKTIPTSTQPFTVSMWCTRIHRDLDGKRVRYVPQNRMNASPKITIFRLLILLACRIGFPSNRSAGSPLKTRLPSFLTHLFKTWAW